LSAESTGRKLLRMSPTARNGKFLRQYFVKQNTKRKPNLDTGHTGDPGNSKMIEEVHIENGKDGSNMNYELAHVAAFGRCGKWCAAGSTLPLGIDGYHREITQRYRQCDWELVAPDKMRCKVAPGLVAPKRIKAKTSQV
jgi:hypothetical protein